MSVYDKIEKKLIQDPFVFISKPTALIGQKKITNYFHFLFLISVKRILGKENDSTRLNNLVGCTVQSLIFSDCVCMDSLSLDVEMS